MATLLSLPAPSPPLAVEVLNKGLHVNKFLVNVDGKAHDIVLGPSDPEHHTVLPHKYQNSIIGRYSNRIPAGISTVEKNGIKVEINAELNEGTAVNLHGGKEGFDTRIWDTITIPSAKLFSPKEKEAIAALPSHAIFSLVSPHGDQGFPGDLLVEVLFALSASPSAVPSENLHIGSVFIFYRAKLLSDVDTFTPVNLTQHWGFNLDASLTQKGQPTVDLRGHSLYIDASNTIDLDINYLSTGKLFPVKDTPLESSGSSTLGDSLPSSGIDSFYVFNPPKNPIESIRLPLASLPELDFVQEVLTAQPRSDPLVKLSSAGSGLSLFFDSNQPGVQYYTFNHANGSGTRKSLHGGSGQANDGYQKQTFAFLEFHEPLAAWLHPEIAVTGDTLLTSHELYNNFVRVDVMFKRPATA